MLQRSKVAEPCAAPQQVSAEQAISAWCCFNKGSVTLSAATDAGAYLPGGAINVAAQVHLTARAPPLRPAISHSRRCHDTLLALLCAEG